MHLTVGSYVYNLRVYDESMVAMQGPERRLPYAIDTETVKLVPGKPVIPAFMQVCCQALRQVDVIPAHLMRKYLIEFYSMNPEFEAVFHNAPFDLDVIGIKNDYNEPMLRALQQERVTDTGIRYMLRQLSVGRVAKKWNLDLVCRQLLRLELDKDEEIRLTFRPGMAVTERHLKYMAADAAATAQLREVTGMNEPYPTEWHQTVGFVALSDIGRRGMYVDRNYMQTLHKDFTERRMANDETLAVFGYYTGEAGNQKVLQSILLTVEEQLQALEGNKDLRFKRTEKKGDIQITDESLAPMGNREHPFITAFKDSEHEQKILSTYLNENLVRDDNRVHPYFTPLVRTGRTSCRGPNLQNLPRKENIRGIYIPTPGYLFYAADYSQLELCALAESCLIRFGFSKMAEVINNGLDVHKWFAAQVVGKGHDIDLVSKEERQMAKACNFGFPGGLGIKTFQYLALNQYGVSLPEDRCRELKKLWIDFFPEMHKHFKQQVDTAFSTKEEDRYIAQTITGRIRRNAGFCSACNYHFQGLAADGARIALWYMWLASYRMVNFVHDEIITELKNDEYLQTRIQHINQLMVLGMQQAIPHVNIEVEGALMRRWYKDAVPVHDEQGNLLIWEPQTA